MDSSSIKLCVTELLWVCGLIANALICIVCVWMLVVFGPFLARAAWLSRGPQESNKGHAATDPRIVPGAPVEPPRRR